MLGKHLDCAFRVVPRRQCVLGSRKCILPAAVDKSLTKLLSLLFSLSHKRRNQITKVFWSGLIAKLCRGVSIEIPQIACRSQCRAKSNVRVAMLGTPTHSFWTEHTRDPNLRMRLLIRQRPGIHMA